jgi:hypothetical protein
MNACTSHNRIVYASPPKGGSGYEKIQSGYALCGILLHHISGVAIKKLLRSFFIATPETSYTTFTLGEIKEKMYKKCLTNVYL